jgi:hypothetical protein
MDLGARSDGSDLSSFSLIQWLSGHYALDPMVYIPLGFLESRVHDAVTPRSLAAPSLELQNAEISTAIFQDFVNQKFAMQAIPHLWPLQTLNSEMLRLNA